MTELERFILSKPCGFIKEGEVPNIIRMNPLVQLLVRCGAKRFLCTAQDVQAMIQAIEKDGDYVRDVSFPTTEIDRAKAAEMCQKMRNTKLKAILSFHEQDCGGVFDGRCVTSDADPGL